METLIFHLTDKRIYTAGCSILIFHLTVKPTAAAVRNTFSATFKSATINKVQCGFSEIKLLYVS